MVWLDVAAIMFSCVMFIHMGLVDAVLGVCKIQKQLPIITCPKCLSFHCVLWYLLFVSHDVILSVAAAFLSSYIAVWLDLFLGIMDVCYERIYRRITEKSSSA